MRGQSVRRGDRPTSTSAQGARRALLLATLACTWLIALGAQGAAGAPFFSTGNPDGKMAMASRPGPGSGTDQETEAADDFPLTAPTAIGSASFVGLLPSGAPLSSIQQVVVEIYRVFPLDSNTGRTINVPTRANSPSDVDLDSRDSVGGTLTFTATVLNPSFTALNHVDTGITVNSGGEGGVTGEEVAFDVSFATPFSLPADHYFFVPQVLLSSGHFFWLSAARPISGGTPFPAGITDLQAWIRNAQLDPDWLRVGTDIVGGATPPTFNAAFSLSAGAATATPTPPPSNTGQRAAALAKCKKRARKHHWSHKRLRKCKKKARLLPI